jgi:hypothetical protein
MDDNDIGSITPDSRFEDFSPHTWEVGPDRLSRCVARLRCQPARNSSANTSSHEP